jgi:hypothetical protein
MEWVGPTENNTGGRCIDRLFFYVNENAATVKFNRKIGV